MFSAQREPYQQRVSLPTIEVGAILLLVIIMIIVSHSLYHHLILYTASVMNREPIRQCRACRAYFNAQFLPISALILEKYAQIGVVAKVSAPGVSAIATLTKTSHIQVLIVPYLHAQLQILIMILLLLHVCLRVRLVIMLVPFLVPA